MKAPDWTDWLTAPRRFAADRRGGIIIMLGFMIIPVMAMVGLALDSSRAYLVKAQLSQAIDAAALAGGRAFKMDYRSEDVQRYFAANFPTGFMDAQLEPLSIDFDDQEGTVTVVASASVPTSFMRILEVPEIDVSAEATVNGLSRGLELALVLDVTGSMEGSKLTTLKVAANSLLDILYGDRETVDNLYVSVVPFAGRVNFSPNGDWMNSLPDPWNGCGDPRSGDRATDDSPPSEEGWDEYSSHHEGWGWDFGCPTLPILPLTAQKSTVAGVIDDLPAHGGTRIDMGMVWGWRVLSPNWRGLWGNPELPFDYDEPQTDKAVIIMTDGKNEVNAYADDVTDAEADQQFAAECEAMKAEGLDIIIYTITFQAPASVEPMMEACATSPNHAFVSPTNDDLEKVFKTIGAQLSKLRISR